jgi:hypothetical protein
MSFEIECRCAGQPLNPGQAGCIPMAGRDKYLILFDYINSDGDYNGVPAGTVLNQAWITAKLNETDMTKRWYIFPEIFSLEAGVPENETEEIDGIPFPTGEEIKQPFSYSHVKEEATPSLKAVYDSLKCRDLGMLTITISGQLAGMNNSGDLIGIHLQQGTLSAQYKQAVKGEVQKMMVSAVVDELENDANRDYIPATSIAYSAKKWFALQPLEIVFTEVSQSGQDEIVFKLNHMYGSLADKTPITGIVTNDFSPDNGVTDGRVYNVTDTANVVCTVVEDTVVEGKYTMTLASPQTVGDEIEIKIFKEGYAMQTVTVTIAAS